MERIRRILDDFLDSSLSELFAQARDRFFIAARDATSPGEESRQLGLMEEVESLAEPVTDAFRGALLSALDNLGERETLSPTLAESGPEPVGNGQSLSLVDTLKLDDLVRLRNTQGRHEACLQDARQIVDRRLSDLSGQRIDGNNNPLGLAGMCSLFHHAMQNMGAGRRVREAIFEAFEATVIERLDELMSTLGSDEAASDPHPEAPSPAEHAGDSPPSTEPESVSAAAGSASEPEAALDTRRLKSVLDNAVRNASLRHAEAATDAATLQAWLTGALEAGEGELAEGDREMIATVSRLVAAVLGDGAVSEPVKARLWQLATPLLALALQDDAYLFGELMAARHDPVTGLLDRAAFAARLKAAVSGEPDGFGYLLCVIDVDDFSRISTTWGPSTGGRLLRLLATLLRKHSGDRGIVARLRGDEFAVLLQGPAVRRAGRFAEGFRRAVEQARWVYEGRAIELTVSVGVVAGNGGDTAERLMQVAEDACMKARAAGGNRVEVSA
jgi:diguanylate cyclase (GGDEF)-like protein